jgi:hypothetical protein
MKDNLKLIKQGLFAIGVVTFIGTTSLVYAAVNDLENDTAGYGTTSEQALAAIDEFNEDFEMYSDDFVEKVKSYVAQAKAALVEAGADEAVDDFDQEFDEQTAMFYMAMDEAVDNFRMRIQSAASLAESKDEFINLFSQAKAEYFNELDAAKNQLAAMLSNMGHNANVIKDQFMNMFNSARDMYGNQLEMIKNEFADTMNNIR